MTEDCRTLREFLFERILQGLAPRLMHCLPDCSTPPRRSPHQWAITPSDIRGCLNVPVVEAAYSHWSVTQLRQRAKDSILAGFNSIDRSALNHLLSLLRYVEAATRMKLTHE